MEYLWNSETLRKITRGQTNKNWDISGVSIDTRNLKKGDMFCAIKGKNYNGHNYLRDAFNKGASAALISEEEYSHSDMPYLKVGNVIKAIQKIAKYSRSSSNAKFISLTGSVGKTGTKEMMRNAFGKVAKVYASQGNLNNHIGLPLSLCRMPKNTEICILELGMNKSGEIKRLSEICNPEIAIITSIENSHLSGLKTLKKIAEAKCEILLELPKNGCCIFNADTNYSELVYKRAKELKLKNIISYGRAKKANVKLENIKIEKNKYFIDAIIFDKKISWCMPDIGEHWVLNSLSLLAVAYFYNYDLNKITLGISNFRIPKGRGNKKQYKLNNKLFTVFDDSYNSNPASLKASLLSFSKINSSGRKIAILGDMLELGKNSLEFHLKFREIIIKTGIDVLLTKGKYMEEVFKIMPKDIESYHFENMDMLINKFKNLIANKDTVLLKGSNSNRLDQLIKNIEGNG